MSIAADFPHLAQRLFNVPLAIREEKAEIIMAALAQRLGIGQFVRSDGAVMSFDDDDDYLGSEDAVESPRGYTLVPGTGVAVIQIYGTLVQKLGSLRPYSGMTGYNGIRQNLLTALADKKVEAIMLDIDSPGGEVAGCFDLADTIYTSRSRKPIWAVLSENAFSAAYALASSTQKVIVPRTGGTGSIGVICLHVDFSTALKKAGVAVTVLKYGEHKDDGAEFAPLSDEVYKRAMIDINTMGAMFDNLVARNRGMSAKRVKSYQASVFMGASGVDVGLADSVMSPDAAMRALIKSL